MVIRARTEPRSPAFALFELCLVVAIIGLLAALAIENFMKSREVTQSTVCVENLEMTHGAKTAWAIENQAGDGRKPSETDLIPFFGGERFPSCPQGGTYIIGKVKQPPTCSAGHKPN